MEVFETYYYYDTFGKLALVKDTVRVFLGNLDDMENVGVVLAQEQDPLFDTWRIMFLMRHRSFIREDTWSELMWPYVWGADPQMLIPQSGSCICHIKEGGWWANWWQTISHAGTHMTYHIHQHWPESMFGEFFLCFELSEIHCLSVESYRGVCEFK